MTNVNVNDENEVNLSTAVAIAVYFTNRENKSRTMTIKRERRTVTFRLSLLLPAVRIEAIETPGWNRNLVKNITAQHIILSSMFDKTKTNQLIIEIIFNH